jgi:hypothetical protein
LKLVNYFLNDFGADLAPMTTRAPAKLPSGPKDTSVVRVAARTEGEHGFVFVNNYVRGLHMPERKGFQVELKLPSGTEKIPEAPIDLPVGAYGIWPVNMSLSGAVADAEVKLRYSTAQLFKRVDRGDQRYYFFFSLPGVSAEFALGAGARLKGISGPVERTSSAAGVTLRVRDASAAEVRLEGGVNLVLLTEPEAEQVWRGDDPAMLLETKADVFSSGAQWTLQSEDLEIKFGVFGAGNPGAELKIAGRGSSGVFTEYSVSLPVVHMRTTATVVQDAKPRGPWTYGQGLSWRPKPLPVKPTVAEFSGAAVWRIDVPQVPAEAAVSDVRLKIDYEGDEARLSDRKGLVDDNFWNGLPWSVGLKEALPDWRSGSDLELAVLPLPRSYPMYLEKAGSLRFDRAGVADALMSVQLIPQYQLRLEIPARR